MELESDSLTSSKLLRALVSSLYFYGLLCLERWLLLHQICVLYLVVLESMLILRFSGEMERQIISGSVRKVLQQFTSTSLAKTLQIGSLSIADSLSPLD